MAYTILVPHDGSPEAESVLSGAAALAVCLGARLLLVRPEDPRVFPGRDAEAWRAYRTALARAALQDAAAKVLHVYPQLRIGATVPLGLFADAVLDEATIERADLIICAASVGAETAPTRLGRVAEAIMRRAEAPVLLLPGGSDTVERWRDLGHLHVGPPHHILLPLSGSAISEAVLPEVVRLAVSLSLRVTVLHVIDPAEQQGHPQGSAAYAYCQRIVAWLKVHGVSATAQIRSGVPTEEIGIATFAGVDMLALGLPETSPWHASFSAVQIVRAACQLAVPTLTVRSHRNESVVSQDGTPHAEEHLLQKAEALAGTSR